MSAPDPRAKREVNEAGRCAIDLAIAEIIERDDAGVTAELARLADEEDALFVVQMVVVLIRVLGDVLKELPPDVRRNDVLAGYAAQFAPDDLTDLDTSP